MGAPRHIETLFMLPLATKAFIRVESPLHITRKDMVIKGHLDGCPLKE